MSDDELEEWFRAAATHTDDIAAALEERTVLDALCMYVWALHRVSNASNHRGVFPPSGCTGWPIDDFGADIIAANTTITTLNLRSKWRGGVRV